MTESEFVKTLINAKQKAAEEYRERPHMWRPVVYESQIYGMQQLFGDQKWGNVEDWLRAHFEVIDDTAQIEAARKNWANIHDMLDKAYQDRMNMTYIAPQRRGKTWLGSQIEQCWIDEHLRVPEVSEVSSLRDIGYSYGPINFYREDRITKWDAGSAQWSRVEESPAVQLKEWLQLRSICRRASSCGMA